MAGIGEAVVGIWGRGRRSAGGSPAFREGCPEEEAPGWARERQRGGEGECVLLCPPPPPHVVPVSGSTLEPAGPEPGPAPGQGVARSALSAGRYRPYGQGRGNAAHSLVSQSSPSQPLGQKQRKASTSSMQVPPLRHGWPRQSSMSAGGERELRPGAARPPPGPVPRPLTLVAVGARKAAVADTGEVAPGLADAMSVGAAHARGAHAGHPGPRLEPAAIDHCHRDKRGQPYLCRTRPPLAPPLAATSLLRAQPTLHPSL